MTVGANESKTNEAHGGALVELLVTGAAAEALRERAFRRRVGSVSACWRRTFASAPVTRRLIRRPPWAGLVSIDGVLSTSAHPYAGDAPSTLLRAGPLGASRQ